MKLNFNFLFFVSISLIVLFSGCTTGQGLTGLDATSTVTSSTLETGTHTMGEDTDIGVVKEAYWQCVGESCVQTTDWKYAGNSCSHDSHCQTNPEGRVPIMSEPVWWNPFTWDFSWLVG